MIRICRDILDIEKRWELDNLLFEKKNKEEVMFTDSLFFDVKEVFETGRYILSVVNEENEKLFSLKYERDYLDFGKNKRLYNTNYDGCDLIRESVFLDKSLIEDVDVFVFWELEEYSWAVARYIIWNYPQKRVFFLDTYAALFFKEEVEILNSVEELPWSKGKKCMYILSDGSSYNGKVPDFAINIYNSINLINSWCWARKVSSYGNLNEDKTILLIDFVGGQNGMGDIVKIVNAYASLAWERGWEPVVDLTGDNQYLDDSQENMWEYYFKPLSQISVQEAKSSRSVISLKENQMDMTHAFVTPFVRYQINRNQKKVYFNSELCKRYETNLPKQIRNEKVLGVIARGTDCERKGKTEAQIGSMINECKIIMKRNGYKYIFIASEDEEYWTAFHEVFGERLISVSQKRIKVNYENEKYQLISDLLDVKKGEKRLWGEKYLFITYCLSRCNALLYNKASGAYYMARKWKETNGDNFELISCIGKETNLVEDELCKYIEFIRKNRLTVIWGTGYLSQSISYIFKRFSDKIIFCDRRAERGEYTFCNAKVITPQDMYDRYLQNDVGILIMAADYAVEIEKELLSWNIEPDKIIKVNRLIAPETIF